MNISLIKKSSVILLPMAVVLFFLVSSVLAATAVISPANMQGWGFTQETPNGSGSMVNGPETPPLGDGSANLIVDSTGGEILAKAAYQGLDLADIDALQYSTYRTLGGNALAIALQFNIDADSADANTAYQGRLVYEPYHTQTVLTGEWQTWNPLNDSAGTGTGNWWFSNAALAAASGCTQANPCTWAEVLTAFPNAEVHSTFGAVVLKAGGGWVGGFDGNVDALTVNDDTYDFEFTEPVPTPSPSPSVAPSVAPSITPSPSVGPAMPTDKEQCKNGGWQSYGVFKNQGDCVSFVATNGKNQPSNP